MSKTIKELNRKVWYRFLKVIFIIIYLLIFFAIIYDAININPGIDRSNSYIICTDTNTTIQLKKTNIYLSIEEIENFNNPNYKNINLLQNKKYEISNLCPYKETEANDCKSISDHDKRIECFVEAIPFYKNFTIDYKHRIFPIKETILYVTILTIIFIIIQKIFYYIALGSIFPKKE